MDKLSEEEIIDKVIMIDQWKVSGDIYTQNELNAIGELLDLYNKEKEKNEKLELENEELKREEAKRSWVHIKENGEVEPLFYISEDKIKAKIEELEKQQKEEPDAYLCIKVLRSLLEKE